MMGVSISETGSTQYVDLQDKHQEVTETKYLSEDLMKNWSRAWTTRAFNSEAVFYETKAYTAAKKHLWYSGWVTLCGYPGDGKTCTAEHLACNFVRGPWQYPMKKDSVWSSLSEPKTDAWERKRYYSNSISETDRQKYTPVFVNSPEEYRSQLDPKEHQIFVIDDIFGEACLDMSRVEMWQPYLEDMLVELTARRPRTLVVICVNKAHLQRLPGEISRMEWFKPGVMVDITSTGTHAPDQEDQKQLIIKNALSGYTNMDQYSMHEAGFFDVKESMGLVYRIYSQINTFKMEGAGFFRDPWKFIQETINKIYRFDRIFYYTLAVAVLLDGRLDLSKPAVSEYDLRTQDVIRELIPLLNVPEHVNLSKMRFAAKQLTGVFLQPTDEWKWTFSHPKIYHMCVRSLLIHIPKDLVRLACPSLILNYIRTMHGTESEDELSVQVADQSYPVLAKKYIVELMSGNLRQYIQSSCYQDLYFVKQWIQQLADLGHQETVIRLRDPVLNRSLFYWACFYGHGYIVKYVLESEQLRFRDEEWFQQEMRQGLYAACGCSSETSLIAVICLLNHGVDVDVCEVYDESSYGNAFSEEFCYLMFIEAPPIHVAAKRGHPDTVNLLLMKGASHSIETKDGLTPLHLAASRVDILSGQVVEALIENGANKDAVTPKGKLPIHAAALSGSRGAFEALVNAGADIHGSMVDGQSFLSIAIQGHQKELVDYLLMKGVNGAGNPTREPYSPLQHAIKIGDKNLADRLIDFKGASVNAISKAGMGALHVAVLYGETDIVDKLIDKGADVNSQGAGNITPLHVAAKHGLYGMCDTLLGAGARPEMMTANQETALVLAAKEGHQMIVWLLLREGMELEGGSGNMDGNFIGGPFFRMFNPQAGLR